MLISPAKEVRGTISLPGDKSISHRAAILSAMAEGETRVDNFAGSEDCASTLRCLERLGVGITRTGTGVIVRGVSKNGFSSPTGDLDCGNSGTTMRLLAGVLASQSFDSVLTGDDSLRGRPMERVIRPLTRMSAHIESDGGKAPLKIYGRARLEGTDHKLEIASAQIKSCLLLAGLGADGNTSVTEPAPTRDHTERMLRWFGVEVEETDGTTLTIDGESRLQARDILVPADISSAVFFLVAAAGLEGSELTMPGVGLNPSRTAVVVALRETGVNIEVANERSENNEPVGDIRVTGGLREDSERVILRGDTIAGVIDELPALAVLGTRLAGGLEVRDAGELRVKESDRIASVVTNLKKMGASVEEFPDGFSVDRSALVGAAVDSYGDHRIAMAFAVAGLFAEGETRIFGGECAAVSFPSFFEVLHDVAIFK